MDNSRDVTYKTNIPINRMDETYRMKIAKFVLSKKPQQI